MQVGGAPTKEFRKKILQTMQVGGANKEISKGNSTDNKLGPNIEADFLSAYNNASWGGALNKRISKGNSTDNVSWGRTK